MAGETAAETAGEADSATSIGEAWRELSQRIDRLDARLLVEHVSGCTHSDLIVRPERSLSTSQQAQLAALAERRVVGEPLAYLVGSAGFYGLEFVVSPAVLIPRPDTEVLVGLAAERAHSLSAPRIVDLGTGSGIVAVMLAHLCPAAAVTAVDFSPAALGVARINAALHGVQVSFLAGDWYAPLGGACFDLIVSNPPYVADGDIHLQKNGLSFEPQTALTDGVAGGDGLSCIRAIIQGAPAHLVCGGWLLLEHGYDQAVQVRALLVAGGFSGVASWCDMAGIERVSGGCRR
jgi:release factor glutamine methyltransferase